MILLVVTAIKASVVLGVALTAAAFLRRRSAELRHWVLTAGVLCACAMPLFVVATPSWDVGVSLPETDLRFKPDAREAASAAISGPEFATTATSRQAEVRGPGRASVSQGATASSVPVSLGHAVALMWAVGTAVSAFMLLAGLIRLRTLTTTSTPLTSPPWGRLAEGAMVRQGLRRQIDLRRSDHSAPVMTWGWVRPKVLLPSGATDWSNERAQVVLAHEFAHIQRGDWITQLAAECLRCVYWFNPIVWFACSRLRQESELACDDVVLREGVEGATYATHLLALARADKAERRMSLPANAIARPSSLERRVATMLNAHVDRNEITPRGRALAVSALVCATVIVAGLAATEQSAALSGVVLDQAGHVVAQASVTLVSQVTRDRQNLESDAAGRFAVTALAPGDYQLLVAKPGFERLLHRVSVDAGERLEQKLVLQLGMLEETITVTYGGANVVPVPRTANAEAIRSIRQTAPAGTIQPPVKVRDLAPYAPASLRGTGFEGKVVLEALIKTDGLVEVQQILAPVDPKTMITVHPDMARAAVTAVSGWQYEPTRLHGVPVDTRANISVNFRPE